MSYLHKYQDRAAYEAATDRPADASNVSLAGQEVIYDGHNTAIPILRGQLRIGDHLVYDKTTGKKMVIRQDGFNLATLDTTRYVDGKAVYYGDIDDKARFVGVESLGNKMFSQYSRCKLTGFDLANGGTVKVTASNFSCEVTYAAGATLAEITAAMTAAKTGSYSSYVLFEELSNGVGVRTWPQISAEGVTLTWNQAVKADGTTVDAKVAWDTLEYYCDLTEIGYSAMDMKGDSGTGRLHKKQYINYISTLASATTFGDEYSSFMNEATFLALNGSGEADKQAMYDKYNGSYEAYANVCADLRLINYDVPRLTAETLRTGEKATKELAAVKMYDFDGTLLDAFPAAAAAYEYGITTDGHTTGFEPGNWHQLGVGELARIMRLATSRTSTLDADDVLNAAIDAGGGTVIVGNVTHALCGARSVNGQLVYYGSYGYLYPNVIHRISSHRVRVSLALDYDNFSQTH